MSARFLAAMIGLAVTMALTSVSVPISHAEEASKAEQRALFRQGARLWPQTCGGCHKGRPSGERSPAEWDTIMMHMRVRANLPGQDAKAIQQFLKSR